MRRALCLMSIGVVSTFIGATEIATVKEVEKTSAPLLIEKTKESLIRQSTKQADINDEVDTQALKLGGIHRREDARQYLELKNEVEKSSDKSLEKNQAPKPVSVDITTK
ncbi:hypothetical protein NDN11_12230 [Acinetobacter sp. C26M]|uniref:hypothetical protein n=1 Tax=unclassified Acinetobacter TaxID=196816 RepID=UPI001422C5AF|nr:MULTISPECIES: hypothetical protein [unclassified Acinetobacter]NIE96917.1 hypothetical protein [Acinetobacter sp. Tr-809]USA45483.1 hypothetical protein NDN11_12230 [Acinetobacter sp. C26M]USA48985.1 hypothetical protein NDN12_12230 [Acinetobacter sp. C26G]